MASVLVVAFVVWLLFGRGGGSFSYQGGEAPPFEISWGGDLERIPPVRDEILRLGGPTADGSQSLEIRPLPAAAAAAEAEDDRLAAIALYAARIRRTPEIDVPARIVLEGRTELAVDRGPEAYQLASVAPAPDGAIVIGKRFLVPDPDRPGEGVEITITETTRDPRVIEKVREMPAGFFLNWPIQLLLEDAASVRTAEGLEEPLRSFAFG